jgi:radical SAM protein with 4Fe4S-binding SPASM domain
LPPQENKKPFAKCSRCKIVSYCSPKCQKSDWSMHKKSCHDASIKYPSFLDNNTSV